MATYHSAAEAYWNLADRDLIVLAAAVDGLERLGDEAAIDALAEAIYSNRIATGALAEQLAEFIVVDRGGHLESEDAWFTRTWNHDGTARITVVVPKN